MMGKNKKNKDIELDEICKYCENATELCSEDTVLCKINGVVSCDYKCKKFVYDPLKRRPRRAKFQGFEDSELDI